MQNYAKNAAIQTFRLLTLKRVMSGAARQCSKHSGLDNSENAAAEVKIPVPWGHIAGKSWGNQLTGRPVLGLHGWLDNCNTFLTLVKYLPSDFFLVLIDWPGHGRSSHRPSGIPYHMTDYVFDLRRVADYFMWKKFSMVGHSLGAIIGMMFASTCPDMVEDLVMLDVISPFSRPAENCPDQLGEAIKQHFDFERAVLAEDAQGPKIFTFDEAVERLLKGTFSYLTEASAKVLMERGSSPYESANGKTKGVILNRDVRVKLRTPLSYTVEHYKAFAKKLTCNMLTISALNDRWPQNTERMQEFRSLYGKSCKKYVHHEVPGDHHIHLNDPEKIAPFIKNFFDPTYNHENDSKTCTCSFHRIERNE